MDILDTSALLIMVGTALICASIGGELLLKKVVVVYPHPHKEIRTDISTIPVSSDVAMSVPFGEKIFETTTEEEYLEAINKPDGCLVITCNAQLRGYKPVTMAVFKEWIYWEPVKDK